MQNFVHLVSQKKLGVFKIVFFSNTSGEIEKVVDQDQEQSDQSESALNC